MSIRPEGSRAPRLAAFVLLAAFAALATAAAAAPQRAPKPEAPQALPTGLKIPVYTPGPPPFHAGEQLVYRASWIGIPAADARITLRGDPRDSALFTGEVWVSTNRLVDIFYKMRDYLREDFSRASLAPRDVYIDQRENRRQTEYRIGFDRSAALVTMVKRHKGANDTVRFRADNPWGPISGAMMALSQPLRPGEHLTFDLFAGHNRYVIALDVGRREHISTPLGEFDALRVIPNLVYLSDDSVRKKAHNTTLWISADQRHLPLRVEAAAFIGTLRADLIQVSGTGAAPIESAQDP